VAHEFGLHKAEIINVHHTYLRELGALGLLGA
jgi:hypothetical protein